MLALVIGGAASGKSEWAERLALRLPGPRVYLATMRPWDAEGRRRIAAHQRRRAGRGFITVECETQLESLRLPPAATVLVEDVGNWLSNRLWDEPNRDPLPPMLAGVENLLTQSEHVILVSNELGLDEAGYSAETQRYRRTLAALHRRLAAQSQLAVEVWAGKAILHKRPKGEEDGQ